MLSDQSIQRLEQAKEKLFPKEGAVEVSSRVEKNVGFIGVAESDVRRFLAEKNLHRVAETLFGLSRSLPSPMKAKTFAVAKKMEEQVEKSFLKQIAVTDDYVLKASKVFEAFFSSLKETKARVGDQIVSLASTEAPTDITFESVNSENAQHLLREIVKHGRVMGKAPVTPVTSPYLDKNKVKQYFSSDYTHGYTVLKSQIVLGVAIHYADADKKDPHAELKAMLDAVRMRTPSKHYLTPGSPVIWKKVVWQWVIAEREWELLAKCTAAPGRIILKGWSLGFSN